MKKKNVSGRQIIEHLREMRDIESSLLDNAIEKRFNIGVFVLGIIFGLISGVLGNYFYNIILNDFPNYFHIILIILIIFFIISGLSLAYLLYKSHKDVKRMWYRYYKAEAEYHTVYTPGKMLKHLKRKK